MSKDLIERLLDNRVTGFNLTVAAVEAADLIEAQAAQIAMMREFIARAPVSSGVCCCGEAIDGHSSPMICGHSPVDLWDHSVEQVLSTTPDQALEQFAAKVREQCVMECEKLIGGKVKNEQWWYGFRAGVSQSISVINKLKELPK